MTFRKATSRGLSILFFTVGLRVASFAQVKLSLPQALTQALQANALLDSANGRIDEAVGQRWQASLKPNPRLTVQSEDIRPSTSEMPFNFVNSTEDYLYVGQVFEMAGKRQRRVDVASSVLQTSRDVYDLTRLQILGNVSAAYWMAASSYRTRDLLQANLQTYEEDVTYSRNRVEEGFMAETDLMRLQSERDRIKMQALAASRAADEAAIRLRRAMGQTGFVSMRLTSSLDSLSRIILPDLQRVLEMHPEMKSARSIVAEAEANLRLQKANSKPDPQVFAGYKRNVGYDTVYGALQIDLPIRNRNQGNIASATAQVRTAEANLRATEIRIKADLDLAIRGYQAQTALLDTLPATLSRAQETERLARAAFREGGIELLRLLDAERNRIQTELDYSRALADTWQTTVALHLASGDSTDWGLLP